MRMKWIIVALSLLLPMVSSFITYTLVSMFSRPIALDTTQATLVCLALMKTLLLGATGVFPIDLNLIFKQVLGEGGFYPDEEEVTTQTSVTDEEEKSTEEDSVEDQEARRSGRSRRNSDRNNSNIINNMLFTTPDVSHTPCIRRFLCEIETVIRTSDDFNARPSENVVDRHPEEEVDVESPDPQLELYTEGVRALFGYNRPSHPDSTPSTKKVLALIQALTGKSCEKAYKLCLGRYTAPMVFKVIFDEVGFRAKDEL
ncbi:hypothetical protein FHG87_007963 [Trinorchestia longiramus]|nr:hypothetical protein FHG87_007963 [Trinorchestia longiramus]